MEIAALKSRNNLALLTSTFQACVCVQLESQLKQKVVQMDNLENALTVAKKELAEQRRGKELAEQVDFPSSVCCANHGSSLAC